MYLKKPSLRPRKASSRSGAKAHREERRKASPPSPHYTTKSYFW